MDDEAGDRELRTDERGGLNPQGAVEVGAGGGPKLGEVRLRRQCFPVGAGRGASTDQTMPNSFATKADLAHFATKADLAELETRLRADLATKADLETLRSELRWMLAFQAALILAIAAKLFGIV